MCAMFLIPTSSQYIDRVFLYLMQKNHLEGFRLSHRGTLVGSKTPAYMVFHLVRTGRSNEWMVVWCNPADASCSSSVFREQRIIIHRSKL